MACVGIALAAPAARADDALSRARRAYADVDYARCADEAQRALQGPAELSARVDAWRLRGMCTAALGDIDVAREAFRRMLAIDRTARLPDGLSPRFTSAYREAKGSLAAGDALAVAVVANSIEGGTRTVRLKIVDELELVHKVGWRGAGGSTGGPFRAAPLLELELPAGADVTVVALDASGGEVAVLKFDAPRPGGARVMADATAEAEAVPEAGASPWVWVGGVTGAVVVLGAVGAAVAIAGLSPKTVTVEAAVVFP